MEWSYLTQRDGCLLNFRLVGVVFDLRNPSILTKGCLLPGPGTERQGGWLMKKQLYLHLSCSMNLGWWAQHHFTTTVLQSNLFKVGPWRTLATVPSNTLQACMCAHLCLTLCDPMDDSLPGSSVWGILQARTLKWVAVSFCRGSYQPWHQTFVSGIGFFTIWATRASYKCLAYSRFNSYLLNWVSSYVHRIVFSRLYCCYFSNIPWLM